MKQVILLSIVLWLSSANHAVLFSVKMLINAISQTESNEVLNGHKTGTFDN